MIIDSCEDDNLGSTVSSPWWLSHHACFDLPNRSPFTKSITFFFTRGIEANLL